VIDLLIVGAGPAGLATALYAHRAGLTCAVVDRRVPPIDKACGEGLMPGTVACLEHVGVSMTGQEFRGIRYRAGDRSAVALFAGRPGLGVRRTALHAFLVGAVRARGIDIRQHTVTDIRQRPDSVTVDGTSARYLVGADGLHSRVRVLSGLAEGPAIGRNRRWGQRCHVDVAPWSDLVEVYWGRAGAGEAYVTPIASDRIGVALLSGSRAPFAEQLAAFPDLAERLSGARCGSVRGAGPLRQRVSARRAGRVLLVGDAAGYVDALTGEGIGVAVRGAEALVSCVRRGRPDAYEAAWRIASRPYRLLTAPLLAAATRPALRRVIVPAAARLPRTFTRAVGLLAG
jgi:flavin-dependent dehydrogenase